MSKEKLIAARQLIKEKQYSEARSILVNVGDPTARKWLAELDRIASTKLQSVNNTASQNLITGISSTTIIATLSIMIFVTFFLAIYGAFLRPTTEVEAQQVSPSQPNSNQWEYISVDYSQNEILGTSYEVNPDVSYYERILVDTEPYLSIFIDVLTQGCTISAQSSLIFDEEAQKCIGRNYVGRDFVLDTLGADGWELIQIDNNSTEYSYKVDMVFKRLIN